MQYELALLAVVDETGQPETHFPAASPYSADEVQDRNFWPESNV